MSQDVFELYRAEGTSGTDARGTTAYLTDQTAASAIGVDAAVNTLVGIRGRTTIFVQAQMSTASATVSLLCVLWDKAGAPVGIAAPGAQTATATVIRDTTGSGDYWAQTLIFDTAGAHSYEVRLAGAPSAGNVDIYTWVA